MPRVLFRFYEELNRYLPDAYRKADQEVRVPSGSRVLDALRRLGVPSAEVDLVLVNGEPAGWGRTLRAGDRVSVYPEFERLDVTGVTQLPNRPLRRPRFIVDRDLEDLARCLQRLGWDVRVGGSLSPSELIAVSRKEKRIVLTRDPRRLAHGRVERGICVRGSGSAEALASEVLQALDLPARPTP
jgi:hypothetical protein